MAAMGVERSPSADRLDLGRGGPSGGRRHTGAHPRRRQRLHGYAALGGLSPADAAVGLGAGAHVVPDAREDSARRGVEAGVHENHQVLKFGAHIQF